LLFSTFFSVWSKTASALSIAFSSLILCSRRIFLPLDFLEMPELPCVAGFGMRLGADGGFADLSDLSVSIEGDVALLAALECIETDQISVWILGRN
jgi:hypothetical protein